MRARAMFGLWLGWAAALGAQGDPEPLLTQLTEFGTRIRPLAVRVANDGSGLFYVVEQDGKIWVAPRGGTANLWLDLSDRVRSPASGGGNEQGLLGLAFPPGFATKGHFYVDYTRRSPTNDGATVLSRFRLAPANGTAPRVADPASEEILLVVPQPFSNHNGGDVHFGPDGYLYFGLGDGGSGGDPGNRSQNPGELLGKLLRLDVESAPVSPATYVIPGDNPFVATPGARPEIWALGLRNPWRWSFDRATGDLWIGDVGQNTFEEINFQPAGTGGLNYQWKRNEAFGTFDAATSLTIGTSTPPVLDHRRADGHRSITGGYRYRGSRYPRLQGKYVYADFVSGSLFVASRVDGAWQARRYPSFSGGIASFGEDEEGNLYVANLSAGTISELRDVVDSAHGRVVSVALDPEDGRATLTFGAALGRSYQVEASEDLITWAPVGDVLAEPAQGDHRLTFTEPATPRPGTGRRYLRAREL